MIYLYVARDLDAKLKKKAEITASYQKTTNDKKQAEETINEKDQKDVCNNCVE